MKRAYRAHTCRRRRRGNVVDDGSSTAPPRSPTDGKERSGVGIHHGTRRGYGGAVRSGLVAATKPWVFFTDGDRQFALEDLGRLIEAADGADAVVGYRIKRADPTRRLFVAWVYNRLIRLLFGGGWRDVDCAFKLFRREVFVRVPLERGGRRRFYHRSCSSPCAARAFASPVGVRHFPGRQDEGASTRVIASDPRSHAVRARLWSTRAISGARAARCPRCSALADHGARQQSRR